MVMSRHQNPGQNHKLMINPTWMALGLYPNRTSPMFTLKETKAAFFLQFLPPARLYIGCTFEKAF
jgi:hypothetical protein